MRRLAALCAAATLVLVGCGTDGPTTDDPTATPTPTEAATDVAPEPTEPAMAGPTVEVLDAGAEPRYPMRLDPQAGQEATIQMRMDIAMDLVIDGEPQPTGELPATIMTMHALVDDVTDDTIRTVVTYRAAELDGEDPGGVQEVLDTLEGLSGTVTTTRSGAFIEGGFLTSGIHPALTDMVQSFDQQLSAMAIPMPEEDLGVGARWVVTTQLGFGGIDTQTTAEYRLAAFDGVVYELETTIQVAMVAGVIDGGAELLDGGGEGTGTVTGRLDFPFAFDGASEMETDMVFQVQGPDGVRVIEQHQTIQMTMSGVA